MKQRYGFDMYPVRGGSKQYQDRIDFFTLVRKDDSELQTAQVRKGLVRVRL